MPAEPRRTSRKLTSEEELELKRARGEISCAECRRLKLKCDKKLPCGSCVRRGCTTICPNGSLSAGQGTRFILADTEQLHRKISEMSERIRQLEDALAIFQAGVSNERHALLRDELLTIKFGPEVRRTVDEENTRETMSTSIDALGTLTIGDHGETKYIGRSGGSETLFLATSDPDAPTDDPVLPPELENIPLSFPFGMIEDEHDMLLDKLQSCLPPQPRAWSLCEAYIEYFSWWFRPIKRDELVNDILTPVYNCVRDPTRHTYHPSEPPDTGRCPHLLAVLYFLLAVGALVDLTLPPCSAEAETYYRLGRVALSLRSVLDSPKYETVQAIALMASYHSLAGSRYSLESGWMLASMASKLSQSMGLHRDSAQWNLDFKIVQRRRSLFWELLTLEMIHCIALGRPLSISRAQIDCENPVDEEASISDSGDIMAGYWQFKLLFTKEIYVEATDSMLSAKAPSYATILDIDRKIRQVALPPVKLYVRPDDDEYDNPASCMKSYLMSQYRSITMLCIHRTYFAQALLDYPKNPLRSPYAPSFLAANRCASVLIRSFIHHYERCPGLSSRFWGMWTHAFSAAIIVGSTATRSPSSTMATNALVELDLIVDVFQKGASSVQRARKALPILLNLKERAHRSYQQFRNRHTEPALDIQLNLSPEDKTQDELAMFGGQTRVVNAKLPNKKRSKKQHRPSASTASTPSDSAGTPGDSTPMSQNMTDVFNDVHPSLMEYLSNFPSASFSVIDPSPPHMMDQAATPQPISMPRPRPPHPAVNTASELPTMPTLPSAETLESMQFFNSLPADLGMGDSSFFGMTGVDDPMTAEVMGLVTGDTCMSEQWMSLMRETGIFDSSWNSQGGFLPLPQEDPATY